MDIDGRPYLVEINLKPTEPCDGKTYRQGYLQARKHGQNYPILTNGDGVVAPVGQVNGEDHVMQTTVNYVAQKAIRHKTSYSALWKPMPQLCEYTLVGLNHSYE